MSTDRLVVVTGGAGFIGSHLCDRLVQDGRRVVCIDSLLTGREQNLAGLAREPRFELIERDVTEPPPDHLRPSRIFHLACAASPRQYQADPVHTMLTCVLGTRNYLELARRRGARFLLTSTSEVYGDPECHPQCEDYRGAVNVNGPRACYDEGKRAAETLVSDYHRTHGIDVRIARIFNTYGPRMDPLDGRVVSNFVCQALGGERLTLYGDGRQTRSFCFVDDMVDALMLLMGSERAGALPVNLGTDDEFTVEELAHLVITLCGRGGPVTYAPLPTDDPQRRRPDLSRAREILGWCARTTLDDGVAMTIASFAEEVSPAPFHGGRRAPAPASFAAGE